MSLFNIKAGFLRHAPLHVTPHNVTGHDTSHYVTHHDTSLHITSCAMIRRITLRHAP